MSLLTDLPMRIARRLRRPLSGGRSVRAALRGAVRAALQRPDPADDDGFPRDPMTVEFEEADARPDPTPEVEQAPEPSYEPAPPEAPSPEVPPPAPAPTTHTGPLEVVPVPADTPDVMRFQCSAPLIDAPSASFTSATAAQQSPLGRALFQLDGVRMIFVTQGFVSVTKTAGASWISLSPAIQRVLLAHLSTRHSVA